MRPKIAIMLLAAFSFSAGASAEPLDFKQDQPKAQKMVLGNDAKLGDRVSRAEGTADKAGKRFFLKGLNVMSPLVIQVLAKDVEKPVNVSLHRFFWTDKDRSGTTNEDGRWGFAGRVHDEVGIWVSAAEASEFYILAWQGTPAPQAFGAGIFVPADSAESGSSWVMMLIAIVLALLVLAVAYLLFKTRRGGAAASLFLLILIASPESNAQDDFAARLAAVEADLESTISTYSEMIGHVQEEINNLNSEVSHLSSVADGQKLEIIDLQNRASMRDLDIDTLMSKIDEVNSQLIELDTTTDRRLNRLAAEDRDLRRLITDVMRQLEALETLHEADRSAVPDPAHDGGVLPMSIACEMYDTPCYTCFLDASDRLRARLAQFEVLRVYYDTQDQYIAQVLGYGDARSGWHQLEQAKWYEVKKDVARGHKQFGVAYADAFERFKVDLENILWTFNDCEAEYAGTTLWYERHGIIFFESFLASYRRP